MNRREIAVFAAAGADHAVDGHLSHSFLDPMAPAVDKLIGDYNAALKLARTASLRMSTDMVIGLEHWSLARPEIFLAVGDRAAAAVRRAARRGRRPPSSRSRPSSPCSSRRSCCSCPIARARPSRTLFIADRLTHDHEGAGADRLGGRHPDVARLLRAREGVALRVSADRGAGRRSA